MSVGIDHWGLPGIRAAVETTEKQVYYEFQGNHWIQAIIDSTVVDSGSTPTTALRPGLILAKKDADGLFYNYDPTATDGTQLAAAILTEPINMLDQTSGTAKDKSFRLMTKGFLKAAQLTALDALARRSLGKMFVFDDDVVGAMGWLGMPKRQISVGGDTTVTAAHNNALFVGSGANVNFTLPTPAAGLAFEFLMASNHNLVVTGSTNLIVMNNAGASTVTASTTNEKIGVHLKVQTVRVGAAWLYLVSNMTVGAATLVIA